MNENNKIVQRIDELLNERGWKLYRLSQESGVPLSTLSTMFKRNTCPTLDNLLKICAGFQITLSEFCEEPQLNAPVTEEIMNLISSYKELSPDNRRLIVMIIQKMLLQEKEHNRH